MASRVWPSSQSKFAMPIRGRLLLSIVGCGVVDVAMVVVVVVVFVVFGVVVNKSGDGSSPGTFGNHFPCHESEAVKREIFWKQIRIIIII